jgi:hypothetical protein
VSDIKTQKTGASVEDFLNAVENERRRSDGFRVLEIMRQLSGEEPAMWGPSIVGFGSYTYKYASGRSGDWPVVGFSPRKRNLTLYIMDGFEGYEELLARLGKHKTGKACLYINKLADVDEEVLRELIVQSIAHVKAMHA